MEALVKHTHGFRIKFWLVNSGDGRPKPHLNIALTAPKHMGGGL